MARIKYFDPADNTWKYADNVAFFAPVLSVNGKTGAVIIAADDVGAEPAGAVSAHNSDNAAHPDIRALLVNTVMKSDISTKKAQLTLEDGSKVLIDVVVASEGTTIETYTNQIPLSIDTDGSVFNGVGYQKGYRLSSSGTAKEQEGSYVTGFIPAKGEDVVRIFGCNWATTAHANNYICAYDANFAFIGALATASGADTLTIHGTNIGNGYEYDTEGNATITLAALDNIAYIRINSRGTSTLIIDPESMIVTINEEIT